MTQRGMRAELGLRYREGQFTPSEAAAITGLSLHLQRDWRSQGLLRAREGGRASFSPRDLAEMRVMVRLRSLGLSLPHAKEVAEQAAPSVVQVALADHRDKTLAVDGPQNRVAQFIDLLERETDGGYLLVLSEVAGPGEVYRDALVIDGQCELVHALDEHILDEETEVAGVVNLWAVAQAIARAAPRPLFTLVMPRNFM